MVKKSPVWVQTLGQENPLEKEMATHPSILAWRIPMVIGARWLQSMVTQSGMTEHVHTQGLRLSGEHPVATQAWGCRELTLAVIWNSSCSFSSSWVCWMLEPVEVWVER